MKIPRTFRLLGHVYTVKEVPRSQWDDFDSCGSCNPRTHEILILAGESRSHMEHTFCHELAHAILNAMGEDELYKREGFVDLLSGLLHQALTTGK